MKTAYLLSVLMISFSSLFGQKYDNNWLYGLNSKSGDPGYGTGLINFENEFSTDTFSSALSFQETVMSMSDSLGNLLFYSNGTSIYNADGDLLENGDSLNSNCDYFPYISHTGYNFLQSLLCLPTPGKKDVYTLFHYEYNFFETFKGTYPERMLQTTIDMKANSGKGKVIEKNKVIATGEFSGFASARHGNGRDWWIVMPSDTGGVYYQFMLSDKGLSPLDSQVVYKEWDRAFNNPNMRDYGWNRFSPDGTKFVNHYPHRGIRVMDFDRCTGEFSSPQKVDNNPFATNPLNADPFGQWNARIPGYGLAISPSGRYAYTSNYIYIVQYDLEATDIRSSRTVVADNDGFLSPWGTQFYTMQLAPDGKIYINCGNSENVMHVINKPDLEGLACDLQQHAIQLPVFNIRSMPYFPNYRLYDFEGSICDTLGIDTPVSTKDIAIEGIEKSKVYPNPSSGEIIVEFQKPIITDYQFVLYNSIGQRVFETKINNGSLTKNIDLSELNKGIYFYGIGYIGKSVFRTGKIIYH